MEHYHMGKYVLCADKHDGIEIYPLHGHALTKVEIEGRKLLDFIHMTYFIRINEIVIDFVKDREGKYWILNVKGFRLDESITLARELRLQEEKELSKGARDDFRKSKREERLSSMTCKMCMMAYKSFEMDKVLPFKMLLLYKQHTQKSGRKTLDLSHLRVLAVDFLSHWVRLCSVCYMLVIHEYELMETENLLADYMNVAVKPPDVMAKPNFDHPAFLPNSLPQWRLMLYFQSLEFTISKLASIKHLYVHYFLFDTRFTFALNSDWVKGTVATFNIAKLYYFFAALDHSVPNFCKKTQVLFRLTRGPDWDNSIASGTSNFFSDFSGEMDENSAIHQSSKVLLFRAEEEAVKLRFVVGLACDRPVPIRDLPITITKQSGLLLPEDSYFSSDPLPAQWLEIFGKEYSLNDSISVLESSQELDANYSPILSSKEIASQPLGSTKILHVGFDLNPETKAGLSSVRSFGHLNGHLSPSGRSAMLRLESHDAPPVQPKPLKVKLSSVSRKLHSKRPSLNSGSLPSIKSDTAATVTSPKSIDNSMHSLKQFMFRASLKESPIVSPTTTEQPSEIKTAKKPKRSLKSAKTRASKTSKAEKTFKLDKQLRMISLYGEGEWKTLSQAALKKSRKGL
jgi:hypothetical protein